MKFDDAEDCWKLEDCWVSYVRAMLEGNGFTVEAAYDQFHELTGRVSRNGHNGKYAASRAEFIAGGEHFALVRGVEAAHYVCRLELKDLKKGILVGADTQIEGVNISRVL